MIAVIAGAMWVGGAALGLTWVFRNRGRMDGETIAAGSLSFAFWPIALAILVLIVIHELARWTREENRWRESE